MNGWVGRAVLAATLGILCWGGAAAGLEKQAGEAPREVRDGRVATDTLPVDTLRADTLRADTLDVGADTVGVDADTAAAEGHVDLEARREALASGDFPQRDSLFQALSSRPGFRAVEYRGEQVELDLEREAVELRGQAQANYTNSVLEAESISYRIAAQFIAARKDIRLATQDGREVTSDSTLYYDVSRVTGTILDARTAFAERGAEWFIRGTATPRGDREVFVERGSFTSCDLEEPHYYFRAGQMKVVSENVIVAWPVTLYIQDVPVAWLPFFAQDIRPGRRSGFLPPRFGLNDIVRPDRGFERSISDFGYYFALNPFMDAQATVDWYSGSFTRLNGAFRYRFLKSFVRGNFMTGYSFGPSGRSLEFRGNHDQQLSPNTDLRVQATFVQDTRLFQDRTFDPRQQTQTINSNFGLTHKASFANISLSGRRQQFLGQQAGRTDLTLPQLNVSFSPVTLFPAPRATAGFFNNATWSAGLNINRQDQSFETRDDLTATTGRLNQSLRFGNVTFSTNANLDDRRTTPFDPDDEGLEPFSQTTLGYAGSASYQVDLMGSTVLRPTLSFDGSAFRSPDTDDAFISAPTRLSVGATLNTDLYGFYPGFGSFTRIRHKVSPRFSYAYSPEVTVPEDRLDIPGFPAAAARERNSLSVNLSQTFEAKVRTVVEETRPGDPADTAAAAPAEESPDDAPLDRALDVELDEWGEPVDEEATDPDPWELADDPDREPEGWQERPADDGLEDEEGWPAGDTLPGERRRPARRVEERTVTLLAIHTSALDFDFTRAGEEPLLTTTRLTNTLSSDLLRGFNLRVSHELFEGTGPDRRFSPFLSEVSTSVTFTSTQGFSGLFGLGNGSPAAVEPPRPPPQAAEARYNLDGFEEPEEPVEEIGRAGPWNLNLSYSLRRSRPIEDTGLPDLLRDTQSLRGSLALQPTPNWRLRWQTQYNITDGSFGEHYLTLDRDLHDWHASFVFARLPNGNVLFSIRVNLKDAPELKVDYDQRTQIGR